MIIGGQGHSKTAR